MINLLIIDDDAVDLEQAQLIAQKTSLALRVTTASDAEQGLARARSTAPDVILLDTNLGELGGEELPRQLRESGIDAAIILLTGTTDPERVAAGITAGAVKYLPKSRLDPERLESAIRAAMRVTQADRRALQAHKDLSRRARQLEQLVEASVLINAQTSLEGTADTSSQAAAEIFGGRAEVEVGIDDQVCSARHGKSSSDEVVEIARELGLAKTYVTLRLERTNVDASEILVAKQLARIILGNAENLALLREATESARERHDIVAIVSHDLRTPLQSLSLGIDTIRLELEAKRMGSTLGSTLDRMRRSVRTMNRLLGDLLDVSSIHDGALSVQVAPADAESILTDVREQYAPIALDKKLDLRVASLGAATSVVCDASRISQALSNLVSNAIRHTEAGHVTLRARVRKDSVRFEVEDSGAGIRPEIQSRLFERLFQEESATSTSGALGLGLYIVKGIAEAHGGTVGVQSELGQGSTFFVEIPRTDRSVYKRRDGEHPPRAVRTTT